MSVSVCRCCLFETSLKSLKNGVVVRCNSKKHKKVMGVSTMCTKTDDLSLEERIKRDLDSGGSVFEDIRAYLEKVIGGDTQRFSGRQGSGRTVLLQRN
jgi:hypothetical protein